MTDIVQRGFKNFVNTVNTTGLAKVLFLGVVYMTAFRYMASGMGFKSGVLGGVHVEAWEPSAGWLFFLAAGLGISDATLIGKRTTDYEYKKLKVLGQQAIAPTTVNADTATVQAQGDVNVNSQPEQVT